MSRRQGLTLERARERVRNLGLVLTKNDNEYRVAPRGGGEKAERAAYYTDDLEDAVKTALFMGLTKGTHIRDAEGRECEVVRVIPGGDSVEVVYPGGHADYISTLYVKHL